MSVVSWMFVRDLAAPAVRRSFPYAAADSFDPAQPTRAEAMAGASAFAATLDRPQIVEVVARQVCAPHPGDGSSGRMGGMDPPSGEGGAAPGFGGDA
jgi:hypothetical protein